MMLTSSWFSFTWACIKAVSDSQITQFFFFFSESAVSVLVFNLPHAFPHVKARQVENKD